MSWPRRALLLTSLVLALVTLVHCAKPAEQPVVVTYHALPG